MSNEKKEQTVRQHVEGTRREWKKDAQNEQTPVPCQFVGAIHKFKEDDLCPHCGYGTLEWDADGDCLECDWCGMDCTDTGKATGK